MYKHYKGKMIVKTRRTVKNINISLGYVTKKIFTGFIYQHQHHTFFLFTPKVLNTKVMDMYLIFI